MSRDEEYESIVSRIAGVTLRLCEIHAVDVPLSKLKRKHYESSRDKLDAQRQVLLKAVIDKLQEGHVR
jgi:hypothetical protein